MFSTVLMAKNEITSLWKEKIQDVQKEPLQKSLQLINREGQTAGDHTNRERHVSCMLSLLFKIVTANLYKQEPMGFWNKRACVIWDKPLRFLKS